MINHSLSKLSKDVLKCLRLLNKRDQKRILIITLVQVALASLDLIGILLIGFLTFITVGDQSLDKLKSNNVLLEKTISLLGNSNNLLVILACSSVFVLVFRTVVSSLITYKTFGYLAKKSAELSSFFTERLLRQTYLSVKSKSTNELTLVLTRGIELITLQIIAPLTLIVSDAYTLFALSILLLFLDPISFIGIISIFITSILTLNYFVKTKPEKVGRLYNELNVVVVEKISESIGMLKETKSKQRIPYYADIVLKNRIEYGGHSASLRFMPYISKYLFEILIVVSAATFGVIQLVFLESPNAITNSVMFIAAGSRITPTLLRIQQGIIGIRSSIGMSRSSIDLIETLVTEGETGNTHSLPLINVGFIPEIKLKNVSYVYPNTESTIINDINLTIEPGKIVGIVGSSGSGKSTLLDLMMGFINPTSGSISVSGMSPSDVIQLWPHEVSYISQESLVIKGTIRENLELGFPNNVINENALKDALVRAGLSEFVNDSELQLETVVSENGENLSTGQRQRLILARAFVSNPSLIIMDESTSNLDSETERKVMDSLKALRGQTTVVIVTHRAASLEGADFIYVMKDGQVVRETTWLDLKSEGL